MPNQNDKPAPLSEGPLDQETIDALTTPPEAMDEQEPKNATWWTPEKYLRAPEPKGFSRLEGDGDWVKILENGGYHEDTRYGDEFDDLQVYVYRQNDDRHLFVELWDSNSALACFFVAAEHADAFYSTAYLQLVRSAALAVQSSLLRRIEKVLIAFVRHGHGTSTIDRHGGWDADDAADCRELKRQRSKDTSNTSNKHPYGNQN
jgi:hypothetical protein